MKLLTVALLYIVTPAPMLDARGFYAPFYMATVRNTSPQHNEVNKHPPTPQPQTRSNLEQGGAKQLLNMKPKHPNAPDELVWSVTGQEKGKPGQYALELFRSVSEQLRGLQTQMGYVKFQSQRIWRQLKKLQRCDSGKLTGNWQAHG